MKKNKINNVIQANDSVKQDDHLLHLKHQVDIDFDENYKYVVKNKLHKFWLSLIWILARPIVPAALFFNHGLKLICPKELKTFIKKEKAYVSVSNHNLILDCAIAVKVNRYRRTYIPTVTDTMKIPFARHIIRALNVVPIPSNLKGLVKFKNDINYAIQDGNVVHFYPESALWPYYNKLRQFKPGGFRFAVDNGVPILPFCIYFRDRKGLWKLLGKRPLATIEVLPPIYPNTELSKKPAISEMMSKCHAEMSAVIDSHYVSSHEYAQIDEKLLELMGVTPEVAPTSAIVPTDIATPTDSIAPTDIATDKSPTATE